MKYENYFITYISFEKVVPKTIIFNNLVRIRKSFKFCLISASSSLVTEIRLAVHCICHEYVDKDKILIVFIKMLLK